MKNCFNHRLRTICVWCMIFCLMLCPILSLAAGSFSNDPDAIERAADSVFMLEVYSGRNQQIAVGSGFVAFDPSILITNYHVIEGGAYVVAVSDDKDRFLLSRICCYDKDKDIAILQFDQTPNVEPLPMDTDGNLKRAQIVVAIGSPAGRRNTVSTGIISSFYNESGKDWIQFTAPISSGSSGGALFNDEGEIIGITTATYATAQNMNMAVKADEVFKLYQRWNRKAADSIGDIKGDLRPELNKTKEETKENVVWISGGGKKYHSNPNCSKMRSPIQMDLLEAIKKGYEPCGKCYK